MIDLAGRTLQSRYRVEREIHATWMSSVWMAFDKQENLDVRIRVPSEDLLRIPGFREAAEKEIAARVRERGTALQIILAGGREGDLPFAVLEAAKGGSLAERLTTRRMDVSAVAIWLPVIASALDRLHDRGIVHRDVVPENIVFDALQEPYLADDSFSAALTSTAPDRSPRVDAPADLGDRPPEILEHRIGPAYDQYSLAAIVFRCLSGRPLQPSDSYLGVGQALAGDLPEPAVEIFERALSVVPKERFSSCGSFATTFLDAAGVEDDQMDATGTLMMDVRDMEKMSPSPPASTEKSAEIPLAAPLAGGKDPSGPYASAKLTGEVGPPRTPASPPPKRSSRGPLLLVLLLVLAAAGAGAFFFLSKGKPGPSKEGEGEGRAEVPDSPPPGDTRPSVRVLSPSANEVVGAGAIEIRGRLDGEGAAYVLVNGLRVAPEDDGHFTAPFEPKSGTNRITLVPYDERDRPGEEEILVIECDPDPPEIADVTPGPGFATRDPEVEVSGRVVDANPAEVFVAGERTELEDDGAFTRRVPLGGGEIVIRIVALDTAGNRSEPTEFVVVHDDKDPVVTIDEPAEGLITAGGEVMAGGTLLDDHPDRVIVNGRDATLVDGRWQAPVTLTGPETEIRAEGFDRAHNRAVATRTVIRDAEPPRIVDLSPSGSTTVKGDTVRITGRVIDAHPESVTATPGDRRVSTKPGGEFEIEVPVGSGTTRIQLVARDGAGLSSPPATLEVSRNDITLQLDVRPPEVDYTTVARVTVTGTTNRPGAHVIVGGISANVTGTRFTADVPLGEGLNEIEVVAALAGAAPARGTFTIHRPAMGEQMSGPATLRTKAGELWTLEPDAALELAPGRGSSRERFALKAGRIRGELSAHTVLELPIGELAVGSDSRAGFRADVRNDRRAEAAAVSGDPLLLTRAQMDRILLATGQVIELEVNPTRRTYVRFWAGRGSRGQVVFFRQATPNLEIYLKIPAGTNGILSEPSGSASTRIASAPDSAGNIELRTVRDQGASGESGIVQPGTHGEVPHER